MATTTSITTTYAGQYARKYISAALLAANTLRGGGVTVKQNIKYQEVVKRLETTGLLADATCDFTPTDTITTTERILTPKELQVNLEICKLDHKSDWEAIEMGFSAWDKIPPNFAEYLLQYVIAKVAASIETAIWQGTASAGSFAGFETLLAANADQPAAQEVLGTTVTAANVLVEMRKVVDKIPDTLYGEAGGAILYVPKGVARAYIQHLGGFGVLQNVAGAENVSDIGGAGIGSQGSMWYGGGALEIDGVPIFIANGMSANKMIATPKDNLWFGTGLLRDENEVKVLDMADKDLSQNVRIGMRFTAGCQFGVGEDVVTYGVTNTAN